MYCWMSATSDRTPIEKEKQRCIFIFRSRPPQNKFYVVKKKSGGVYKLQRNISIELLTDTYMARSSIQVTR
jgi:hypothetical protein